MRQVVEASVGQGRYARSTFIKLDCGHERSLGGHVLNGEVQTPSQMLGAPYRCSDSYCANIR